MKPGKLLAAARRELIANPKKAAVLALLLVGAAWFWGPIVWRSIGGSKPAPPIQSVNSAGSAATMAASLKPELQKQPEASWHELLAARRHDPLTLPAKFNPQWPQPFKVKAVAATAGTQGEAEPVQTVLTPTQAGLVLESIVFGAARRAAMINGEIYREGMEVAVGSAPGAVVSFQVVHIDRESIALERYGRTYRLEFPRPKLPPSKADHHRQLPAAAAAANSP